MEEQGRIGGSRGRRSGTNAQQAVERLCGLAAGTGTGTLAVAGRARFCWLPSLSATYVQRTPPLRLQSGLHPRSRHNGHETWTPFVPPAPELLKEGTNTPSLCFL